MSCSSARIARENGDCSIPTRCAARAKCRSSAIAMKYRRWSIFMQRFSLMAKREHKAPHPMPAQSRGDDLPFETRRSSLEFAHS
jgi:hypothetical protein